MLVVGLSKFHFFSDYSSVVGVGCGTNHFIFNYYGVFLIGKVAVLTYCMIFHFLAYFVTKIRQNSFFLACGGERSLLVVCVTHCLFYSALL